MNGSAELAELRSAPVIACGEHVVRARRSGNGSGALACGCFGHGNGHVDGRV